MRILSEEEQVGHCSLPHHYLGNHGCKNGGVKWPVLRMLYEEFLTTWKIAHMALRHHPTQRLGFNRVLSLYEVQFIYFSLTWNQVKIYKSIHLSECLAISSDLP